MSTGTLKKPSRPPPPPPIHSGDSYNFNSSHHHPSNSSSSSSSATFASHKKSSSRLSDYIKISDCHTGLPDKHLTSPFDSKYNTGFAFGAHKGKTSATNASFSSATLKPTTNLFPSGTSSSSPLAHHNQFPFDPAAFSQVNHQKSRSLTENHLNPSSYDLPPYDAQHHLHHQTSHRGNKHHSSTRCSNNASTNDNAFGCNQRYFKQQQVDNRKSSSSMSPATVYKTVDFLKTEALTKCKVERTSGRGSDFSRLLVSSSSNQRKS